MAPYLETYVDGMPINQPTHAHGQGHTGLNFMIPELADQIAYTKGPYCADVGDFGAVGSVRVGYRDTISRRLRRRLFPIARPDRWRPRGTKQSLGELR